MFKFLRTRKLKVKLLPVAATSFSAESAILVTIDPQFADLATDVSQLVADLVGHDAVAVLPIPSGALNFYEIKDSDPAWESLENIRRMHNGN